MFYVEWTSTPENRRGRMVSMDALSILLNLSNPGYSSIYLFKEEDALKIKESGNSSGLNKFEVGGAFLVVDIDNGKEGLDKLTHVLNKQELSFEVWESGGKGYHVYIPHEFCMSEHLPFFHKKTLESLLPLADSIVDMSLYQHGRLLSLPGRVHPKTKKKKTFLYKSNGSRKIELIKLPPKPEEQKLKLSTDENMLTKGLERVISMIQSPPMPGNRHTAIWGAAKDLLEGGLSKNSVLEILLGVNESWLEKKLESDVQMAINQAEKTLITF